MKRSQEESDRIRKKAYKLYSNGVSASKIAEVIGVSERMVYRYIDAERLKTAEDQVAHFTRAINLLDKDTLEKVKIAIGQVKM